MKHPDFTKATVLVIGDIMLDKYHFGKVRRISPEAPVPVVKVEKSHFALGGAGNVAHNIAHLQGNAVLTGFVGRDNNRAILSELLDEAGVKSILVETEMPTITKVRVIGEHQQIVRLDFEEIGKINHRYTSEIMANAKKMVDKVNAIIISDYDKGVCSPDICRYIIKSANDNNVYIIVDPKGKDWDKYRGATVVKPNVKELSYIAGKEIANVDSEIEKYGMEVLNEYGVRHLLVTRSEKGMSLVSHHGVSHFPTEAKEVFDISGAGDTVVATLSVAIGCGLDLEASALLANKAAGIVVSKMGTATLEYEELIFSHDRDSNKVVDVKRISKIVNDLRLKNKKIVFTNGFFDIIHKGHIAHLKEAEKLGDVLIVGMNSDASIKRLKGPEMPINNEKDRAEVLSALEYVDYICIFKEDTPDNLIQAIRPDVVYTQND
ncbi:MAG: D-glycero-beta-D-manno-heptose-7-phosphate kinase [Nitrospirae bacterium]|nr:D-glycero-beta-D-manno-heptose-7-phosphate kinase [Nitrospirota bacterium]